ncbi:HTH domain-containing protein [Staphylococcus pseudintermedius]|nr:HTH domain-containing protein [Staphylococcus pseudintermedius]EGQ3485199.1 HTH domain-containing protein [Staphylococcus pseudintermedius]EGQ4315647.1 HTH domain-containing protein [Staphylococcus pseudintermedius]EIN4411451.1 HTH domain-containing protein [Staphylococcus pseudintermedius]EJD5782717.1 HTH domain-containing protein [Staphylococcus pseudintermedius]
MNKETRQKKLLALIQQDKPMTALELAQALNVSKRTILRDMQELEGKGVQIVAHAGMYGGYQLQANQHYYQLNLTQTELQALYLILKESQAQSTLPYEAATNHLIQKILKQPYTHIRRTLRQLDQYVLYETRQQPRLPVQFSDILIYCQERKVMGIDYKSDANDEQRFENVIFIGLIARRDGWQAIVYHIGGDYTQYVDISTIEDISYSFQKSIQTNDITLENYETYLKDSKHQ